MNARLLAAFAIALVGGACVDMGTTHAGPTSPLKPTTASASMVATPCVVGWPAPYSDYFTSIPFSGSGCDNSWTMSVPPLVTPNTYSFWWRTTDSFHPSAHLNPDSGWAYQNGPLVVNFSKVIKSGTVFSVLGWNIDMFPAVPGVRVVAVNANRDTVSSAIQGSAPVTVTGTGITGLVIYPVVAQVIPGGDTWVRNSLYQIGWEPQPVDSCDFPNDAAPDPITHDQAVKDGFRDLWSLTNATANMAQRHEPFAWITYSNGQYQLVTWPTLFSFCGGNFTAVVPANTVAFVHAHPYVKDELVPTCDANMRINGSAKYEGVPSTFDRATADSLAPRSALPAYILDTWGVIRFFGNVPGVPDRTRGRCGY